MARSAIAVTALTRAGVAPGAQTTADATNKHFFANDGRTWVEIISTDAGPQTVSFEIPATVDGQAVASKSVAVAAGATVLAGMWPTTNYNQADNTVYVDPSVSTTLKFRGYRI